MVTVTAEPLCAGPPSTESHIPATPERLSVAAKCTVTLVFCQPMDASEVVTGAVRSILIAEAVAVALLSARSRTEADVESAAPSP